MSATANVTEYSAEGSDRADQQQLLETTERLDENGVDFVLSNSGVTYNRYDDAGFAVETVGATRSLNSDETARGEVEEVIATNVPEGRRAGRSQAGTADF